jgi:soluble lytic murein transglycosylase-like protein
VSRPGGSLARRAAAAGLLLAAAGALLAPVAAGDAIYYRRDADGNLVITNVPDRRDLRVLTQERRAVRPGSGAQFRDMIERAAREHGLHPDLVYAVAAVESSFDPLARSVKGAQGLMQLMPETADRFGVRDAWNPEDNVRGGASFLRYLLDLFEGNLRLALAAYNAGENAVLTQGRIPPYAETRTYVAKIMKRFGDGRDPYLHETSEADTPPETVAEQPAH